jgi:flagella basal body P-ring formation protein FlgA
MSDGKFGDLVNVKSDGSLRVVDGIVISPGVIKVTL